MNLIKSLDSQKLINLVVAYQSLSIQKEQAIQAMEELGLRRAQGETLDYEAIIEARVKEVLAVELASRLNPI